MPLRLGQEIQAVPWQTELNKYMRKGDNMSLVIDTLRTSTITEELSDAEVDILAGLF